MFTEPFSAFINHLFSSAINSNSVSVQEEINFSFLLLRKASNFPLPSVTGGGNALGRLN